MSVCNSCNLIILLTIHILVQEASWVSSGTSTPTTTSTTQAPKLPDIPNAIHYPIYIPATTTRDSSFLSSAFDLMGMGSNPWSSSLSPLTGLSSSSSSAFFPLSYDWMGQPFGVEVYDEQTLLRNREKLRRKQLDAMRSREKMRQQSSNVRRHVHGTPFINSYSTFLNGNTINGDATNNLQYSSYSNGDRNNDKNNYDRQVGNEAGFGRKEYTSVRNSWQSEQGNSNGNPIWK